MIRTFLTNIDTTFFNPIENGDPAFNSTTETILKSITINSGEIESDITGKTLTISMFSTKPITNSSTYDFKFYYNTANTITGAIQISSLSTTTTDTSPYMIRTFNIYDTLGNAGLMDQLNPVSSFYNDWGDLNDTLSTNTDVRSPQSGTTYFILTGRRTSVGSDSVTIKDFVLEL